MEIVASDLRVPVPASTADDGPAEWEIAATVFLPGGTASGGHSPVLVVMPGGGYNRRYFDLPAPGYSQARHHARNGIVVIAIDHLGTGDSTLPPAGDSDLAAVAAASHAAVTSIVADLMKGTLVPNVPPLEPDCVVGAGHALGGHALAAMQARHGTFDGVALLGSSVSGTTFPARLGTAPPVIPAGVTREEAAAIVRDCVDWEWVFHWEDDDPAGLIAADVADGVPRRRVAPAWGATTYPDFSVMSSLPGLIAAEAAVIDVPVLIARGERDVCRTAAEEVAAFASATDISLYVVPEMAHMHNFAATRMRLWERLDEFVAHVAKTTTSWAFGW